MARYSSDQIEGFFRKFSEDGFCVLPGHIPREKLLRWQEAFRPLLTEFISQYADSSYRGAHRHYITLPFRAPFADPEIFENDDVLAIVEKIVGKDFVMCQLASDTPMLGSDYQEVHSDAPQLFEETELVSPPFQLAVNFPLVDVAPENGPTDFVRGTHMLSKAEGLARLQDGRAKIEPLTMKLGDVVIRDVRALHRGTPNRTDVPRPMIVIGYSRRWFRRPEVSVQIPRAEWEKLSPRAKNMLRFEPVVDAVQDGVKQETYKAFAY